MKIAIIVRNLSEGGAERVAALWARGFHERGYEVCVFISDENAPITYKLPEGVLIENVVYHHSNKLLRNIGHILKYRNRLKNYAPDVIINVTPRWRYLFYMLGINAYKISTEHSSFERPVNSPYQPRKINKIYLNRLYDHVTVLTEADKKVIGNQLAHVTVLPNPLAFEPIENIPPKENIILAVGRLDGWYTKGFDVLIKAWAKVAHQYDGWKLVIAGGGKEVSLNKLKAICQDNHIVNAVQFEGFQSDIIDYYKRASIFVLSSRFEGFGMVLIEAMSQGCASIACDFKRRQREIITNDSQGMVCEAESIEALASSLSQLISDESKRKMLQANAIKRASDFELKHIMDKWEWILDNIIH